MIVQIYETRSPAEARALADAGVSNVGVLVGDGAFPREIPIAEAMNIFRAVKGRATTVALSLSASLADVAGIAEALFPDILHIGAAAELMSVTDICALKRQFRHIELMRAIPVTGGEALDVARSYEGVADWLLLDSHIPGDIQIGAVGKTHDWAISAKIVETVSVPVILAGGLGPSNVGQAIRRVRPAGVDSKTLTDRTGSHRTAHGASAGLPTKGNKDLQKVARFVRAAQRAG